MRCWIMASWAMTKRVGEGKCVRIVSRSNWRELSQSEQRNWVVDILIAMMGVI